MNKKIFKIVIVILYVVVFLSVLVISIVDFKTNRWNAVVGWVLASVLAIMVSVPVMVCLQKRNVDKKD